VRIRALARLHQRLSADVCDSHSCRGFAGLSISTSRDVRMGQQDIDCVMTVKEIPLLKKL
jgi:hypothetical protein